jgi:NAD(P)-dependent dehydrogenase (short-subunit alcohol dehydrogenase family)
VSGRRDEEGQKLVSEIRQKGAEAEFVHADVRREEDVRNLIDKTVARYGRLDVAVNAAGTEGVPGPVMEQTAESYAATFDTNVLGTLLSMKHELRVMLPQKNGSIVNISSTYGHTGAPGASVYSASKHAVEGLTKSAALEAAGTGVRVNVIAPGPIETAMLDRFTKTEERKAGLASTVPLRRVGNPKRLLRRSFLFPPRKRPSSQELPTSSTAVKRRNKSHSRGRTVTSEPWSSDVRSPLLCRDRKRQKRRNRARPVHAFRLNLVSSRKTFNADQT